MPPRARRRRPNRGAAGLLVFMTLAAVLGGLIHQTHGSVYRDHLKIASLPALPDTSVFERLKTYEHYDRLVPRPAGHERAPGGGVRHELANRR